MENWWDSNKSKNDDKFCGCNGLVYSDNGSLQPLDVNYDVIATDDSVEPVTLSEFKQHARIDYNVDDNLCLMYIKGARSRIESYLRRCLVKSNVTMTAKQLPKDYVVDFCPITTSITPTLLPDRLENEAGQNLIFEWTSEPTNIAFEIKIAIMRLACVMYENREDSDNLKDILSSIKRFKRPQF